MSSENGHVIKSTLDGLCTIEFYHPAHNALPGNLLESLRTSILDAGKDADVRVILLKSAGDRTFCAGASFNELISIQDEEIGKKFFSGFANVINAIRSCGKIVIGRIQGKAVGGGVGLASAVDYCFATKYASVKLSELNIGIGPFVIGPAVSRKVGLSAFSQMGLDAQTFYSAEWAREKGMYTHIYESAELMDAAIAEFAIKLANYNPEALIEMKKMLWIGTEDWDVLLSERASISGRLVLSEFTKNMLAKYSK